MRQWHALVIGVDRYPAFPPRNHLAGCVNDATAIHKFLLERVRIDASNARLLTSPREPAGTPATAANIRAEFDSLPDRVGDGDHLVLFYAGHGLKLSCAAVDGVTRAHYGFAPEDTARNANGYANLILGSEIHALLKAVEAKGATATVIADTCHSGASTRSIEDDPRERFLRIEPLSEAQWREFEGQHPALRSADERGFAGSATRLNAYPGREYVMLTGCLDSETSKEDDEVLIGDDGTRTTVRHGLLSLALLKELESVPADAVRSLRWADFHERLRRTVAQRVINIKSTSQTVALEGRREKTVFGGAWQAFAPGFTVRAAADGTLTVDGGELHGLAPGAMIAIYPPATTDFDTAAAERIEAAIEASTPMTSTVARRELTAAVADSSRARLIRTAPNQAPITVRVAAGVSMPARLRDELNRGLDPAAAVTLCDDPAAPAHAEVRRWIGAVPGAVWPSPDAFANAQDGWVLTRNDSFGVPSTRAREVVTADDVIAYLPGECAPIREIPVDRRDETLGQALAQGVSAYARYLQRRDRCGDTTLASMLEVRLRAGESAEPPTREALDALPALQPVNGLYSLTEASWIWAEIRVMRETSLRLQVGWVMFSDDGNVVPLWPPEGSQPSWPTGSAVFVGFDREGALSLTKRADQLSSLYTLAVIAVTAPPDAPPLNIAGLAQDSVQAEFARAIDRARGIHYRDAAMPAPEGASPAWCSWNFRVAIAARR